jgi:hypothetical protein
VNQENPTRFEPNNQILPAPLHGDDRLAFELDGHLAGIVRSGQSRVQDLDAIERAADQVGLEARADRLDLWQLGHVASVARVFRG